MMRGWIAGLVLLFSAAETRAQEVPVEPQGTHDGTPEAAPTPAPEAEPDVDTEQPPRHDAPITPAAPPPETAAPASAAREGRGLAIGLGWLHNTATGQTVDVLTPNVAAARVRLASGWVIQPFLKLSYQDVSSVLEDDMGMELDRAGVTNKELSVGASLRAPLASRAPLGLSFIVNVFAGIATETQTGDMMDVTEKSTETLAGLAWGIGIDWRLHPHFVLSVDALNSLAGYLERKTERPMASVETTSGSAISLQISPAVMVLLLACW